MSRAARAMTSAEVPLAVARQYFESSRWAQASSNCATCLPPVRFHRPLRSTSTQAFSSLSRIWGQEGNRRSRTGAPPSSAGLSIGLESAAKAVAEAAARKVLRVFVLLMDVTHSYATTRLRPGKQVKNDEARLLDRRIVDRIHEDGFDL